MKLKIAKENKSTENMHHVIFSFDVECNAITQINTLEFLKDSGQIFHFILAEIKLSIRIKAKN